MLTRRRLIALSAGHALALSLSGRAAWAQTQSLDWPNRVVRFIVPFAAGGPTDIVARVVTEQLSKIWGQQAVIENRGGAGTNIGNAMVARSDPDGYTVLFATASLAVNRSLARRPPSTTSSPAAWTVILVAARCWKTCGRASCVDLRLPAPKEIRWRRNCPRWPRPAFRVTRFRRGTACSCRPERHLKSSGRLSVDTIAALADPVVKSKLEQAGYMVVGSSPDELQTLLKSEVDKWSAAIKAVGIKIN